MDLPQTRLPDISDAQMQANLGRSREYAVLVLRAGPNYASSGTPALIWEHGRRNFALRAAGKLAIVCPVLDDSDLCGVGLFDASVDETRKLMADDPAVLAGVLTVEVHPGRSFPGDVLPGAPVSGG
jgi:hypothetical protein